MDSKPLTCLGLRAMAFVRMVCSTMSKPKTWKQNLSPFQMASLPMVEGSTAGKEPAPTDEPSDNPPNKDRLNLHEGLRKAESSLLAQIRKGIIGLRAFFSEQKVPDIASPVCPCGISQETSAHVAAYCSSILSTRRGLPPRWRSRRPDSRAPCSGHRNCLPRPRPFRPT